MGDTWLHVVEALAKDLPQITAVLALEWLTQGVPEQQGLDLHQAAAVAFVELADSHFI